MTPWAVALAVLLSLNPPAATTGPAKDFAGSWCIASQPLVYNFLLDEHTPEEIRAWMREVRALELVRVHVQGESITLEQPPHAPSKGTLVFGGKGKEATVRVRWNGPAAQTFLPDRPIPYEVNEHGIRLEWKDPWFLLISAASPNCMQADQATVLGQQAPFTPPSGSNPPAMRWAKSPPQKWPQLVLTNEVRFREPASEMSGASAFLFSAGGRTYAGTVAHLLGESGGVEPPVPLAQLDARLESWTLSVRTRPKPSVRATRLAMKELERAQDSDWLLLEVEPKKELPATPLTVRKTPVALGERVFLVGCEYRERNCRQRVFSGRVSGRAGNGVFRYVLETPVVLRGFSGAPIVDANGHLAGVMTIQFPAFNVDGEYLEGGGLDASLALEFLKQP
ncbi:trypsin-like peptidase [Archangium gephyra]|uniref:Trypsin-like peptidase n=1 Tax=Archangium gephyra TaxID=48 RepID=A0ABX9JSU2_9BACT|nr:serine protease [Archangium gephyra]REG26514.1 trypsin-like peptidase [Archangium gephyra]